MAGKPGHLWIGRATGQKQYFRILSTSARFQLPTLCLRGRACLSCVAVDAFVDDASLLEPY